MTRFSTLFLFCAYILCADNCPLPGILAALRQPSPLDLLQSCLPAPVPREQQLAEIASLPPKGRIFHLSPRSAAKLTAVRSFLSSHHRDNTYEIVVIDIPQATVALHRRTILLISSPALEFLSAPELESLAAHELAHELLWDQFAAARKAGDTPTLRQIELACDRFAAAARPPAHLYRALEKCHRYNAERLFRFANEDAYPTLSERRAVILSSPRNTP